MTTVVTDENKDFVLLPRIVKMAVRKKNYIPQKMNKFKSILASKCASMILRRVRRGGHLTSISESCGMNRKDFKCETFKKLSFYRVVRVLFCYASWTSRESFVRLGVELFGTIYDYNEKCDGKLWKEK